MARSTNVAPEWAGWNVIDRQIFGDLTHHFAGDWVARISAVRRATSEADELFYVYGNPVRGAPGGIAPDPANPGEFLGIKSYPGAFARRRAT